MAKPSLDDLADMAADEKQLQVLREQRWLEHKVNSQGMTFEIERYLLLKYGIDLDDGNNV